MSVATSREMWRTVTQILCAGCLRYRNSAILNRLFGNGALTCDRCGYRVTDN